MGCDHTATMSNFKGRKIVQVIGYLLRQFYVRGVFSIDKLKLIKMIWLADRINIRRNASTITGDTYYAMPFGPVASYTLDVINNNNNVDEDTQHRARQFFEINGRNIDIKEVAADFEYLSDEEKQNLQKSFDILLAQDSKVISDESHKFPEWTRYEAEMEQTKSSRFKIKKEDFFDNPEDSVLLKTDEGENKELVALNKKLFLSNPLAE